ncbi:POTRA domain-containing protein [Labilithrix luteola]|uniref:POTRA domain-containing protein n=1 Tax=Labilithrix luteola TaxID=1391654 RepID=UPI001475F460|nr:POTRA domain-containing protein [Labilithrix luteola]
MWTRKRRNALARAFALGLLLAWSLWGSTADAETPAHAQVPGQPLALPARIDEIRIEGLARTKPFVVRRELGFVEGDVIDQHAFDLAVARLWNTAIFAHVDAHVVRDAERNVLVLRIEDKWTLIPIFDFGSGGGAFYFDVGATDNNVAGRFLDAAAEYQNFQGLHGGRAMFHDPRFLGTRTDLFVKGERLVRPRPGFSDQRTLGSVEVDRLTFEDRIRAGLRVSIFADRFVPPTHGTAFYPPETNTVLVEPSFRIGRVDTVRLRQRGARLELRPGLGFNWGQDEGTYVSFVAEVLAFAMFGRRWNLATRVRAAGIDHVPEQLELYAGGLDFIRGFPDNFVRTQAYALTNVELRFVAFDSTWLALMPAVFTDAIAARSPSGTPGTALSVGAGLRVLVPKFVGTGARVDFAIPLESTLRAVTVAEQPLFGPATPTPNMHSFQLSLGVYQFF